MARHEVEDLDDYLRLLALFRNTRAIEAQNARGRHAEIKELIRSVETARYAILRRLNDGRSPAP
jgi:hypothetical protein